MTDEQKAILNALLDKYEKSVRFTEGRQASRKVSLNFCNNGKNDFPPYDIEDYEAHMAYNRAVEELLQLGLVGREWMKGQRNHLIARVWLNVEQLQQAHQMIGRTPKADTLDAVCSLLEDALPRINSEWGKRYLDDCLMRVRGRKSLSDWLPQQHSEMEELLAVLSAAGEVGEAETLERVFSTRVLGNSKLFEKKYRSWLVKIVKDYLLEDVNNVTDEEVLEQVGIIKYPEKISFCGGLSASFGGREVNFDAIPCGVSVDIAWLLDARMTIAAHSILLIENKANFVDYIANHRQEDELVIFHGGCYSQVKGKLLEKLAALSLGIPIYHWGDIDWGGFSMLSRLRKNIFPALLPYRMDEQELKSYAQSTLLITGSNYIDRLRKLLDDEQLLDCHPCISYMVEHRVKLEQEAML